MVTAIRAGVDLEYILDRAELWEANLIIEAADKDREESWQQTRNVAFHAIAPHLKKGTTIDKFMELPWDKNRKLGQAAKVDPKRKAEFLAASNQILKSI